MVNNFLINSLSFEGNFSFNLLLQRGQKYSFLTISSLGDIIEEITRFTEKMIIITQINVNKSLYTIFFGETQADDGGVRFFVDTMTAEEIGQLVFGN